MILDLRSVKLLFYEKNSTILSHLEIPETHILRILSQNRAKGIKFQNDRRHPEKGRN